MALHGGMWTLDSHILIIEKVQLGVQIENIPLNYVDLWIQVHNLPTGLMLERFGKAMENFIGSFVEYKKNNNSRFGRHYMRLRVKVNVRKSLKKQTKVKNKGREWCTIIFKYERLGLFYFVCGILGHSEHRCEVRFVMAEDNVIRGWSNELRVGSRGCGDGPLSKWLKRKSGG